MRLHEVAWKAYTIVKIFAFRDSKLESKGKWIIKSTAVLHYGTQRMKN